jgi:hypothetical protein
VPSNNDSLSSTWRARFPSTTYVPSQRTGTYLVAHYESQIIVENEVLVDRVNALTHDLEKAYGGKAKLDFILGSQRCSLNR